ncbi:hypothetical protein X805_21310 [Sphaerotilus natans subsp. natans DSM 6575]|uniref:Uncharacterized protein n=1 Tax=Sphaerotilus natans subsp. natans DSM 6575 TaxID=1286631 RepID=A0A059KM55_9BURK|nr:hypothetical protein X805_21310 [Sphaerotilus natans subsp. natans DSM 6575]
MPQPDFVHSDVSNAADYSGGGRFSGHQGIHSEAVTPVTHFPFSRLSSDVQVKAARHGLIPPP